MPLLDVPPAQDPRVGVSSLPISAAALSVDLAWSLLLQIVKRVRVQGPIIEPIGVQLDGDGRLLQTSVARGTLILDPDADRGWSQPSGPGGRLPADTVELLDLYMPLCVGPRASSFVVAHLAQSLDGRVATASGSSQFISGHQDLAHTHRLRALSDAVVVGAYTVEHDDPRLTTRLVMGPSPVRVIIDPRGRLPAHHRVFTQTDAPTIVVRAQGCEVDVPPDANVLELPTEGDWISIPTLLEALEQQGVRRVFVEGGGITVSGFLRARALDRLHITVAPMLLGSGRPAISLPEVATIDAAMRVSCRHFRLGEDLLFDCPLPR